MFHCGGLWIARNKLSQLLRSELYSIHFHVVFDDFLELIAGDRHPWFAKET